MKVSWCRSFPFCWYPTVHIGRWDFGRSRGVLCSWLGWSASVEAGRAAVKCLWCGVETDHPVADLFQHFWLYRQGEWQYLKGNCRTFGKWDGFWVTVYLVFPVVNSLRHWRLRKARLVLKP